MNFTSVSIAWRYARSRSGSRFLNFITLFSIGGIMLGVCALIIVLSVMNGFENQLKHRILGAVPHLVIKNGLDESLTVSSTNSGYIAAITPISLSQAMVQGDNELSAVMLQGIDPTQDKLVNPIASNMRYGKFDSLTPGKYNVLLGRSLARQLNVTVGDKIRIISAQRSVFTPFGRMPSQRNFTISGVFEMESQADTSIVIVHIKDALRLLREPKSKTPDSRIFLYNAFDDAIVSAQLTQHSSAPLTINSWRADYGALFAAVNMEKNMMWLMLSLIIAVAAFNIISALVILVTEKQTDIAILATLGLSRTKIAMIFICQGTFNGLIGTLVGTALGLTLTFYLNDLLNFFNLNIIANPGDPGAGLPILINSQQIVMLVVATVLVTLISTLYPSYKAGNVDPAKALKHD